MFFGAPGLRAPITPAARPVVNVLRIGSSPFALFLVETKTAKIVRRCCSRADHRIHAPHLASPPTAEPPAQVQCALSLVFALCRTT